MRGALGTIKQHDTGARRSWWQRLRTLLVITGPGLVVMVGDNDAGAVQTYSQAGQNYGMSLVWTLALLIPVLYVNQEMVVRLGAVSGVGHARLIFQRFGKFWGAFSVTDLFILNALTIVTEFIGVAMALQFLGMSKYLAVPLAAVLLLARYRSPGWGVVDGVVHQVLRALNRPYMWPRTHAMGPVSTAVAGWRRYLVSP